MKRILICATLMTTTKSFLIPQIQLLKNIGYIVDLAGNKDTNDLDELVNNVYDIPFQRTPFSKSNLIASHKLKEIARNNSYDIIYFHTPVASAFGRWGVKEFRKTGTKVFYTVHGFHFYKGAPLKNWLLYFPVELWLSRFTDVLITINMEDYQRAKLLLKPERVEYIPGVGVDTKKYSGAVVNKSLKRKELGLPETAFVVLSAGELNKNKNHETVIKAIAKLNSPNIYYIICGNGILEDYLNKFIRESGLDEHVKLLGYRRDMQDIYKVSDVFAFPSYREGLSVALMEAMAAGLPVVCSKIRGNTDLIKNGKGGIHCSSDNIDEFKDALIQLSENEAVRKIMSNYNRNIMKAYDLENIVDLLRNIFEWGYTDDKEVFL